jgi:hypothetical protein
MTNELAANLIAGALLVAALGLAVFVTYTFWKGRRPRDRQR